MKKLIGLIIIVQCIFFGYIYQQTVDDFGNKAITISLGVARAVDIQQYEEIVRTKDRTPHFYQMQDYFRQVQTDTGVKYLYIKHKISDTQIEYIYDGGADSLGELDDLYTPEAYTSKTSLHTGVKSYDKWGTFITGYSPLINSQGENVGVVGTDIEINNCYTVLLKRLISSFLYMAVTAFIVGVIIYRKKRQD